MQQKILSDKKFEWSAEPSLPSKNLAEYIDKVENYLTKVLAVPVSTTSLAELSEILTMFSTATFV